MRTHRIQSHLGDVLPIDHYISLLQLDPSEKSLGNTTLPSSRSPNDPGPLTGMDGEAHIAKRERQVGPVSERHVSKSDFAVGGPGGWRIGWKRGGRRGREGSVVMDPLDVVLPASVISEGDQVQGEKWETDHFLFAISEERYQAGQRCCVSTP
jgi:hypothetical protein